MDLPVVGYYGGFTYNHPIDIYSAQGSLHNNSGTEITEKLPLKVRIIKKIFMMEHNMN